ncbi:MAG: hypothetical protein AAGA61_03345 [Pseudomonadota bacterium]
MSLLMRLLIGLLAGAATAAAADDDLPDWSGVWERFEGNGGMFDVATTTPPDGRAGSPGVRQHPPLTDVWEQKYRATLDLVAAGRLPDPISYCGTPAGYPRLLALPDVYEFVVRPEQTWIISENGPNVMRIHTDGRDHPPPEELWPTFTGDSVGYWDDERLHFSTISMIGEEKTILDRSGLTLSQKATIRTTLYRLDDGRLRAELVIEDPLALRAPWHVVRHFRRLPNGTRAYDYACNENNRNPITATGQTLTLDAEGKIIDKVIEEKD